MLGAWDLNKPFTPKFKKGDRIKTKEGFVPMISIVAEDSFKNESGQEVFFLNSFEGYFDCNLWEKI